MKRREFLWKIGSAAWGGILTGCALQNVPSYSERSDSITLGIEHSQNVFSGTAVRPSCHCATLTELPGGDLFAVWYAGSKEGAPDVAILGSKLPHGEKAWTPAEVIVPAAHHGQGNPVVFVDGRERVHLIYNTRYEASWEKCKIHARLSEDAGETWGAEHTIRNDFGWMVRNKPIRLANGELLLPIYDERYWSAKVLISADEGASWEAHGDITAPTGCIQPAVIQQSDGTLWALLRRGNHGTCIWTSKMYEAANLSKLGELAAPCAIWQTHSLDNGRTWSKTEPVGLPNPNAAIDMVRLNDGRILLVFNDSHQKRTPLSLAQFNESRDAWEVLLQLEDGQGEFSYPSLIQASDGRIHGVYTFRREAIKHVALSL